MRLRLQNSSAPERRCLIGDRIPPKEMALERAPPHSIPQNYRLHFYRRSRSLCCSSVAIMPVQSGRMRPCHPGPTLRELGEESIHWTRISFPLDIKACTQATSHEKVRVSRGSTIKSTCCRRKIAKRLIVDRQICPEAARFGTKRHSLIEVSR